MRKGGSKQKGAQFEREISVTLSKWLSNGEHPDLLWRSAMSGGRATVWRDKKGILISNQSGDLSSIHPKAHNFIDNFYVEAKNYRDLNYCGLLTNTGHLYKFWQSTVVEAKKYKKHPMLIAKQNHLPIVIFLTVFGLRFLGLTDMQCVITAPKLKCFGVLFDDFLKLAKPL